MNGSEAIEAIEAALEKVVGSRSGGLSQQDNLVELGLLDSIGMVTFVYHFEALAGRKLFSDDELTPERFTVDQLVARFSG